MLTRKIITTATVLIVIFAYAIIRYNIIKGVAWEQLPLFISNKAISLSAIAFIALSYMLGSLARFWPKTFVSALPLRKFFGLLGFGLAALHGLISLLIFTPAYYPKFFSITGKLNLIGELSMLFGVLAFFVFAAVAFTSIPAVTKSMDPERWLAVQRLGYFGLILVFFHVFTMGFEGWLKPEGWPGGLLPISLVAAIVIVLALFFKIIAVVFPKEKEEI
ncbi:MAG: ferric reductase-like transmembrane domain-containing protein [Patescibacteria group bacterium]